MDEAEKNEYSAKLQDLNAEKTALDQMLVDSLKQSLSLRKEIVMKDNAIKDLMLKINEAEKKIKGLQDSLNSLQDAQISE